MTGKDLPRVALVALGGTITFKANHASGEAGQKPAYTDAEELVKSIPGLAELATVEVINDVREDAGDMILWKELLLKQVGGPDINTHIIKRVISGIMMALRIKDYAGVVITTGTDTMSELGTALHHAIPKLVKTPVVLTGAMRPAHVLGADGLRNLSDAIRVAVHDDSRDRGVLGVMNGKIFLLPFFHKSDANSLDAFTGGEAGPIGRVEEDRLTFFTMPCRANLEPIGFNYHMCGWFPKVDILYASMKRATYNENSESFEKEEQSHARAFESVIERAIKGGTLGFVLAGEGAGCWDLTLGAKLAELTTKWPKIPFVASRRTATGYVGQGNIYGLGKSCFRAGYYTPEQAKIVLQIALYEQKDLATVFKM